MAALASFDDYINRASNGYIVHRHFGAELTAVTTALQVTQRFFTRLLQSTR